MGMWGARTKAHEAEAEHANANALPAGRLDQLMTFVERAMVPAAEAVEHHLPPRLAPSPEYVEQRPPAPVDAQPEPVEPEPVAEPTLIAFPEPLLVLPTPAAGKRRRLLPQSA